MRGYADAAPESDLPMPRPDYIRQIYRATEIVRRPTYGIVRGYHELPYCCLGERAGEGEGATSVRGKIMVSPQFIVRPADYMPDYAEVFGEENVDLELRGRLFGFMGLARRAVECSSEYLEIRHHEQSVDALLDETLDQLARHEDITTGVIRTPDSRYYPVSVERFISTILDDEFSV